MSSLTRLIFSNFQSAQSGVLALALLGANYVPIAVIAEPNKNSTVYTDSVVASVNGKPITLNDVCALLHPPRRLTLKEASEDHEFQSALDSLLLSHTIEEEAALHKLSVGDGEISSYIEEVARRNNLTADGLARALQGQGKSMDEYRASLKVDILKSKLVTNVVQPGIQISDSDIDKYVSEHPELAQSGTKLKLSRIVISIANRSEEEAAKLAQAIKEKLSGGASFAQLAAQFSEAPEAKDGGLVGIVAEKELSPELFEKLVHLNQASVSEPIAIPGGLGLFLVEERFDADASGGESLRNEVRKTLQEQRLEGAIVTYFSTDIFQNHAIERKL